jgi:(1->4)-alpha-D-glucan 1-alpha-D-glucosylmutase
VARVPGPLGRINKRLRVRWQESVAPARNDEYLLYQTLVGAWPLPPTSPEESAAFVARIQAYMQKAVHEAKIYTSWVNPNAAYDDAVRQFVAGLLDPGTNARFFRDFGPFQERVSHFGLFNALSQVLLKVASPGVPDIYQGTEIWDFTLVDPDNRRPVDYSRRQQQLAELRDKMAATRRLPELARNLAETKEDGRIKLYVTHGALCCRRAHPGLFSEGEYLPVDARGARRDNVVAFVRCHRGQAVLVVVPRLLTGLIAGPGELPLGPEVWQDTALPLPALPPRWRNVFTGEVLATEPRPGQPVLPLGRVFAHFPVALLLAYD